jgi:hypothetical protein
MGAEVTMQLLLYQGPYSVFCFLPVVERPAASHLNTYHYDRGLLSKYLNIEIG